MLNKIVGWVDNLKNRQAFIQDFNKKATDSYVQQHTSTLLGAKTTVGCSEFKHPFSKFMASGFNIKAFSKAVLRQNELQNIGNDIIKDENFVRKLISLGWDTLEVQDVYGFCACKWELKKYIGN